MIANYTPSKIVTSTEYSIEFIRKDTSGFSFPCDSTGKLHELNPEAQKNYEWCLGHPEEFDVKFNKVKTYTWRYRENPSGTCTCGHTIELFNELYGACECPHCGRWWNMSGQELLPPNQWDECGEY